MVKDGCEFFLCSHSHNYIPPSKTHSFFVANRMIVMIEMMTNITRRVLFRNQLRYSRRTAGTCKRVKKCRIHRFSLGNDQTLGKS